MRGELASIAMAVLLGYSTSSAGRMVVREMQTAASAVGDTRAPRPIKSEAHWGELAQASGGQSPEQQGAIMRAWKKTHWIACAAVCLGLVACGSKEGATSNSSSPSTSASSPKGDSSSKTADNKGDKDKADKDKAD